jgi:hypothetical protein
MWPRTTSRQQDARRGQRSVQDRGPERAVPRPGEGRAWRVEGLRLLLPSTRSIAPQAPKNTLPHSISIPTRRSTSLATIVLLRRNLSPTRHAEPSNFPRNRMKTKKSGATYSTLKMRLCAHKNRRTLGAQSELPRAALTSPFAVSGDPARADPVRGEDRIAALSERCRTGLGRRWDPARGAPGESNGPVLPAFRTSVAHFISPGIRASVEALPFAAPFPRASVNPLMIAVLSERFRARLGRRCDPARGAPGESNGPLLPAFRTSAAHFISPGIRALVEALPFAAPFPRASAFSGSSTSSASFTSSASCTSPPGSHAESRPLLTQRPFAIDPIPARGRRHARRIIDRSRVSPAESAQCPVIRPRPSRQKAQT